MAGPNPNPENKDVQIGMILDRVDEMVDKVCRAIEYHADSQKSVKLLKMLYDGKYGTSKDDMPVDTGTLEGILKDFANPMVKNTPPS